MSIEIIQANFWDWKPLWKQGSVNHIITDYPYGTEFDLEYCKGICPGNIITFCASEDYPFKPTERAYWIKTPSTKNYSKKLGRFVEKIFIYRQDDTFNRLHWSQMTGVYDDRVLFADGHQYRKPLSLCERLVRIYTNPGDTVLDPFCGEGTILEACQNLGRNAIGIDNNPECVRICKQKFEEKS